MPEDAKLKVIARRSNQLMTHVVTVWLCVLDCASRNNPRGTVKLDSEQIAVVQDIDQAIVESILAAFYEKGMIDQKNHLSGWEKRQYASDAERVQKHRESKKQDVTPCNTVQRNVTSSNDEKRKNDKIAPDTDTDTDTDNRVQNTELQKSDKKSRAREEKGECEREKRTKQILDPQILQMLEIWNAEVQSKLTPDQKAKLTPKRQEQMAKRWQDDFQQDMRAWKHYCEIISTSDFCLGKIAGKSWTIDLSWAVESSEHVAKILEGGFSGGNHPTKPTPCAVPELQSVWDKVLAEFTSKYGKPTCRSWLARVSITRVLKYGDGSVVSLCCPSKFIKDWLTQHYLADLTYWFAEANPQITRVELITEG